MCNKHCFLAEKSTLRHLWIEGRSSEATSTLEKGARATGELYKTKIRFFAHVVITARQLLLEFGALDQFIAK